MIGRTTSAGKALNGARNVSARRILLDPAEIPASERAAAEARFFESICMPNGTRKTTSTGRLRDVDTAVVSQLAKGASVNLLDIGISSGVTTDELIAELTSHGHQVQGVGIELSVHAYLRRILGIDVLFDRQGSVLQFSILGRSQGRPDASFTSIAARLFRAAIAASERLFVRRWAREPQRATAVMLVNRRLQERTNFRIVEHDICAPMPEMPEKFDVIRAANVLNLAYFSPADMKAIVSRLVEVLKPRGVLVICRTSVADSSNNATIFQKAGDTSCQIRPVQRIGSGSELEGWLIRESICQA